MHDNEIVQRGATLFKLDDAPFRIAVDDATAHLAATRLQIESLKSTYRQRQVGAARPHKIPRPTPSSNIDRQTRLLASGIASRAQFDQAAHALDAATTTGRQRAAADRRGTRQPGRQSRISRRSSIRWSQQAQAALIAPSSISPIP